MAQKSRSVLDIGSYTGIYSLLAAAINPRSKIYAFEALDVVYSRLLINKHSNNFGNLKCQNKAIGASNCNIELSLKAGDLILSSGSSISKVVGDFYKTVNCITLNTLIHDLCIDNLDLIKIDVEGSEFDIIESSWDFISDQSPDLLIECLSGSNSDEASEYFKELGYYFYKIDDKDMKLIRTNTIVPASFMYDLNTLITKKSEKEIRSYL